MSIGFLGLSRFRLALDNLLRTENGEEGRVALVQNAQPLTRDALYAHAKQLAAEDAPQVLGRGSRVLFRRFSSNCLQLDAAYRILSEAAQNKEFLTPGAEWLLDNYHVIQRQIQDIRKHFPRGYDRSLPKMIAGPYAGYPRVYQLALEFLRNSASVVGVDILSAFVGGYQERQVLTLGELWAVPIMLRFALIENLSSLARRMVAMRQERKEAATLVDEILGEETQLGTQILLQLAAKLSAKPDFAMAGAPYLLRRLRERGRRAALTVQWFEERLREEGLEPEEVLRTEQHVLASDQITIGNSFTSLKAISFIDWKTWVESVSVVHAVLSRDPGRVYLRSDFRTRDLLRHRIELIAKRSRKSEVELSQEVVALATEAAARTNGTGVPSGLALRKTLVSYYLLEGGRREFEQRIGYRPHFFVGLARFGREHAIEVYLGAILCISMICMGQVYSFILSHGGSFPLAFIVSMLFLIPASEIATTIIQWIVTRLVPPYQLPKLEFKDGVPEECKTVVVVQTIFPDVDAVESAVNALEVRYLANIDLNVVYGILADLPDADSETTPADHSIIEAAEQAIAKLRERYESLGFFVLFRRRLWNEAQGKFMGWERKRGKIEEFNRLILRRGETTFILRDDIVRLLQGVRYCITLDNDSQLPRGVVRELAGTIAHPLNQPVLDDSRTRIVAGYSIIQPRMGVSLLSANSSRFAAIFSGHAGLDPYTQTVSEVYQDLFREGSFIGKGIYDVEAFSSALENRVPENALLSHDLFEGNHVRVALASDIELFDDFPSRYHVHTRRLHRWVRGDWQLIPWLFRKVPNARRESIPTVMSMLGRYKLFDNLRRSLVAPTIFILFLLGCVVLPGTFSYWLAWIVFVVAIPIYLNIAQAFMIPARGLSITSHVQGVGRDLVVMSKRALLTLCFIPHQAYLMFDAVSITLYRLYVSRRHLLEWETAASAERKLGTSIFSFIREMRMGLLLTALAAGAILWLHPENFPLALPLLLLWTASPWIARELSTSTSLEEIKISPADSEYLHTIAWRTWRYFREHINPEHNYLIPDNIQLVPLRVVAARTSPTNISLSVLTVISAYDLGFFTIPMATERIRNIFDSLQRLEKFRGHFLNWYSTRTLDPLHPRYVSFVDSGNLVGHLLAARVAFAEFKSSSLINERHFAHIRRLLREAGTVLGQLQGHVRGPAEAAISALMQRLEKHPENTRELIALLHAVRAMEDRIPEFVVNHRDKGGLIDRLLVLDEEVGEVTRILSFFDWCQPYETICGQLKGIQLPDTLSAAITEIESFLTVRCPTLEALAGLHSTVRTLSTELAALEKTGSVSTDRRQALHLAAGEFISAWERSHHQATELLTMLDGLIKEGAEIVAGVDFTFLYDADRDLFAIGYDISNARRDTSYYDLLASEARLGGLVAVALGQVPQRHWFALGRPLTDAAGGKVLVSWGGTMFEYLMPMIMTKAFPNTLLSETYRMAVRAQIEYGSRLGVPWGVSESGYSGVDFEKTYQYHAFGVPGLGLKRGLEEDLVISPYSTLLALPVLFDESLENLRALEREGFTGEYGYYEAADYTPDRLSVNERKHMVQSFFAHHQGMSLVSLNNVLNAGIFQERFHTDQRVKATELLLQERFPDRIPIIVPHTGHLFPVERETEKTGHFTLQSYSTPHTEIPLTHLLSNGRYALMVDNAGSGFSVFEREVALTRWREDSVTNNYGSYVFVRDLEAGNYWSVAYQPSCVEPESYEVFFGPDKIEFKRTDSEIFIHTEITVSPEDNVEIRRIALTNLSSRRRVLELTSYGEVVLQSGRADIAHPAFSKMAIESEFLSDLDALLVTRRPRSVHEERVFLLHMVTQRLVWDRVHYESSRFEFIGRGNTLCRPAALEPNAQLSGSTGLVLDPIFSLRTRIEIEPGQTETVTFITAMAKQRDEVLGLANRYRELHHVSRAFEMAWSQSGVELRSEHGAARQWHIFQRLGNALLFNVEKLRGRQDVIIRNRLAQSALWRFGIGGDYPICLVRITEPDQSKLVQEALHAHHFLRMRGLIFELVILNEYPGGYLQNLQEELDYLIKSSLSGALSEKKGGIFLRTALQLNDEERDLLQATSRVVLSGLRGTLEHQLKLDERPLESILPSGKSAAPRISKGKDSRFEDAELFNSYGGFIEDGSAYAIEVADRLPPLPWSNIVSNQSFGFLATETGGGYTWADNCRENRITPWSNDPVSDPLGECVFIRDADTGVYWNPTPRPVKTKGRFIVEHHFGFTRYQTELEGIESELTLTTAPQDRTKWYALRLQNTGAQARSLELFFYVDWVLGVIREETSRHIVTSFNEVSQALVAVNHYNADFGGHLSFIGSSHPLDGFTTSRIEFVGRNRDLTAPRLLELALRTQSGATHNPLHVSGKGVQLSRKAGAGFESCGVLKVSLSLKPKQNELVLFFLGNAPSRDDMAGTIQRSSNVELYQQAAKSFKENVREITDGIRVTTPEPAFNRLMSGWLVYQSHTSRILARTGFYQSGGAWGFRDQLQDVLALLPTHPELARKQILLHASRQFPEGDVQHWWHPPSGKGVRTKISDDFLWLPMVTERYLEVTGDTGVLDERVSFIEGPKLGENEHEAYIVPQPAGKDAPLYDHCVLAVERGLHFGGHGLPLIGCGDWNDGMNEVGRQGFGESVWLGWFLLYVLRRFAPIVSARGDQERADRFLRIADQLEESIDREAWDGDWYRRAYFDDGTPLGSRLNDECQIDSIAQSWSVIAGAKNRERSVQALQSAYDHLVDSQHGIIKLLAPPFDKGVLLPGYIKGYLPGIRENGGQYTHAAVWMVIAYALLGDGEKALKLFEMINPLNHTRSEEQVRVYKGEPYVMCGDVYAVAPHEGRAGWSWYTGSASWMFQAGIEYILGLKLHPTYFTVDPCVPATWKDFGFDYRRNGVTYEIRVSNPKGVQGGVKEIAIGGSVTPDGKVPLKGQAGSTVQVWVVMG